MFPLSYIYSIISLQKNPTKVLRIDTTFLHNYWLCWFQILFLRKKFYISYLFVNCSSIQIYFFEKIKEISDGSSDFIWRKYVSRNFRLKQNFFAVSRYLHPHLHLKDRYWRHILGLNSVNTQWRQYLDSRVSCRPWVYSNVSIWT